MQNYLLVLILLILIHSQTYSDEQKSTKLGFVIGYNRSMFIGDFRLTNNLDPLEPIFTNASGDGYTFGISSRLAIPQLRSSNFTSEVLFNLQYDNLSGFANKIGDKYPSLVDDGNGGYQTIVAPSYEYKLDFNYCVINLSAIYSFYPFGSEISLYVGGSMGLVYTNHLKGSVNLLNEGRLDTSTTIKPPTSKIIRYEDNYRTGIYSDTDIPNVSKIRFGWLFGLGYDIKLSNFILTPSISYNTNFKINFLTFKLGIYF